MRGWAFTSSSSEEEEDERTDVAAGQAGVEGWSGMVGGTILMKCVYSVE